MSFKRFAAVLSAICAVLAAVLIIFNRVTTLEISSLMHESVNLCVAAKVGSGREGYPIANSQIVSTRKTSQGGVAYLLASVQGFGGSSKEPELLWSSIVPCRVVLKTDVNGELQPDYCMLPRDDENRENDVSLMFSPLTRLEISKLEKSEKTLDKLEALNLDDAVVYFKESEEVSEFSVILIESDEDSKISIKPTLLKKVHGKLEMTALITNNTGGIICYTNEFRLEKLVDDAFIEVPARSDYEFSTGMSVLSNGSSDDMLYHLNAFSDDIKPGTYRISVDCYTSLKANPDEKITVTITIGVGE